MVVCCFFFQAEDGIRVYDVTGVQTCALPIFRRGLTADVSQPAWYRIGGIGIWDIALAMMAVAVSLYLPLLPAEIVAHRVGAPSSSDVVMGTLLLLLVLEATRRSVGFTLPLIAIIFVAYAIFGTYAPGALKHPGASWKGLINHLYMRSEERRVGKECRSRWSPYP